MSANARMISPEGANINNDFDLHLERRDIKNRQDYCPA
jgi:hypothetical protein